MAKDIVILGGGFGGVYAAYYLLKALKPGEANVTLVNRTNYFLFVPLLHEVATGNIRIHNVVEPIRDILKGDNFFFCKSEVKSINLKKKEVKLDGETLKYDYLVTALGSETNFYGMKGQKYCFTLKSLHDAYRLRNHVIDMFEEASMSRKKERREELLSFVIVGGGATGVELACEMSDWIYKNFNKKYPGIDMDEVSLRLVHPYSKVLNGVDEKLREKAMKVMRKKNIMLDMESRATGIKKSSLSYEQGGRKKKIKSRTIIWTAGVKPLDIHVKGIKKQKEGFLVDSDLRLKGFKNEFAIGDIAGYRNQDDGSYPPPAAQLAQKQAKIAAENIISLLREKETSPFVYHSSGFLASLGNMNAIAKINGIRFYGFFAWWVWRTIYLSKLIGTENKLRVVIDWTFDLFFPRDTSQV